MGLTLCAIVKDEAATVGRMIESVRALIDSYVIIDTGSTDDTQDVILDALHGLPGVIVESDWVDFGTNRTELVQIARREYPDGYLLLLDADMTIAGDLPTTAVNADRVLLTVNDGAAYRYALPLMVAADVDWAYHGRVHEYLDTADGSATTSVVWEGCEVIHHCDGGTRADKFQRDADLLHLDAETNPRSAYYMGNTCRDLGELDTAVDWYEKRASMGGWDEEVYMALLSAGRIVNEQGEWPRAMEFFLRAIEVRPTRWEALYELVAGMRTRGWYRSAYALTWDPFVRCADLLFVEHWCGEWGLTFERSILAFYVGRYEEAIGLCDDLLGVVSLPEVYRVQTEANRMFAADALHTL